MAFRGSTLEQDSCTGNVQGNEMARPHRVGKTSPSTGRHVQGLTESDGCLLVRQTLPSAELQGNSKVQGGNTGSPIDELRPGDMAHRTTGSRIEDSIQEKRTFGSGTVVDQMTFVRRSSPEQRTFGSGTSVNPGTVSRQQLEEQRTFGSGTLVDKMSFGRSSSPEQTISGSGTFVNLGTVSRQQLEEQRTFGSGKLVDQLTFCRCSSQEQRIFGSATFMDPRTCDCSSSQEQRIFDSGKIVNQMAVPSPEQKTFHSGTFIDPMTAARQSLLEQRAFGSGRIFDQMKSNVRSSPDQRTSSVFPAQLDELVENRDQSEEESRQSLVTIAMETWTIDDDDDDDVPLPESTVFVDPAVFAQDEDGDTMLHLAIISERNDLALRLIQLSPDLLWLDLTNHRKQTPLHLATIRRQPSVIRRLLSRGAKRVVHDIRGNTPLHIACEKGHLDCVQALISSCSASTMTSDDLGLDEFNYEGLTCLHLAASKNQIDVIGYLVENCILNVNQKELRRGCTLLHLAVMTSNLELLNYLLSLPASAELIIDEPTYDGYTALHLSNLTHQTYIEEMLRLAGAHTVFYFDDRPSDQSQT